MRSHVGIALLACMSLVSGCDAQNSGSTSAVEATQDTPGNKAIANSLKPPAPDSVLYFIYKRDGDGATSYEVEGGMVASYWYGYEFEFKGVHYFTGFGNMTTGDEGPDGQRDFAEDPDMVAISQATFIRAASDGKEAWKHVDSDGYLGEFGRNERAEELDSSRDVQSHETKDGRLVVAIPTKDFVNGISESRFSIFVFDPDLVNKDGFRKWRYLGFVNTGNDNEAACSDGEVMPCVVSKGQLKFDAEGNGGLPDLSVMLSGTTISGPGQTHTLGAQDGLKYTFVSESGRYKED